MVTKYQFNSIDIYKNCYHFVRSPFKQMEEIPVCVCAVDQVTTSIGERLKRETLRLHKSSTIVTFDCTVITLCAGTLDCNGFGLESCISLDLIDSSPTFTISRVLYKTKNNSDVS